MPIRVPRPTPAGAFQIPSVPPPASGLGSNSNYILYSDCNSILDLTITIHLTQDLVWQSSSGLPDGFTLQLNAYSPHNQVSGWQQYVIAMHDEWMEGQIETWTVEGSSDLINARVRLMPISELTIPAEYELTISLIAREDSAIYGASYTVTDVGITPVAGSALDGYIGTSGEQHVNFIGTDGHVHELFIRPEEKWIHNDLTKLSGNGVAPMAGSALDGYARNSGDQHVNFIGIDGHVRELHIEPEGSWENNDLTVLSKSTVLPAPGTALDGYWGLDGSQHVNYIGTDGHVHELYIHPGAGWVDNDLTLLSKSDTTPMPGSPLSGYWGPGLEENNYSQHVNYIGRDGHVRELYIHSGAQWVDNDLIKLSGNGVGPVAGSSLDSYWGPDQGQHVNFIGTDGHVRELYIYPGAQWVNNDLIHQSGDGVAPMPGSSLHGYVGPDSGQHVNFIGLDGHLRELYIHPDAQWVNNDLIDMSGDGVGPAAGTALDGYWGDDDSQHVNFIGTDGHLHELYIHPGAKWVNNDLNHFELTNETQTIETLPSRDYSPITAFEFNIVGGGNGASAVFSSGAGIITYTASTPLKVLNVLPSCTEATLITAETANTIYGPMDPGPSETLVQYFYVSTEMPMIHKKGRHAGHGLSVKRSGAA